MAFATGFAAAAFADESVVAVIDTVVPDDTGVVVDKMAVVAADTCVADMVAAVCMAVAADKEAVVDKAVAAVGDNLVVDEGAVVCMVVLVDNHLVVDKGVVAVDTGVGMVAADHTVKDLVGEALGEAFGEALGKKAVEEADPDHSVHFVLGLEVWLVVLMPVKALRLVLHGQPCRSRRH